MCLLAALNSHDVMYVVEIMKIPNLRIVCPRIGVQTIGNHCQDSAGCNSNRE